MSCAPVQLGRKHKRLVKLRVRPHLTLREKWHSADSYFKDVPSSFDKQGIYGLGINAECDPIAAPKSALQLIGTVQALANTPEDQY
jgi:hypothetical protein